MKTDLRSWIETVEAQGELKRLDGADWNKEIGTVVELNAKVHGPALLFDRVKDYPPGFRVLAGAMARAKLLTLTLGLPAELEGFELIRFMKEKMRGWSDNMATYAPLPVEDGPIFQNVDRGAQVNILKFPAPLWHEEDGGRYIGTGSVAIMRERNGDWVNLGTYRVMVHDEKSAGIFIAPGHHGRVIMESYWNHGEPCPIAISAGHHPAIFFGGSYSLPAGVSEYNYIGAVFGERIPVVPGKITGLPLPAFSEIVLEGYLHPNDVKSEGRFGEWPGYYVSEARPEPVIRVEAVYYRNEPILLGAWPGRPPHDSTYRSSIIKSANLWELMERARIGGIAGVYRPESGGANLLTLISLKQGYDGHARQAGVVASQLLHPSHSTRYVIVVDDDIDVLDLEEVMWAVCTRSDPARSITIIDHTHANMLDPMVRSRFDESAGLTGSCAIIDACRPFSRRNQFPKVAESSAEFKKQVREKWAKILQL
ncbi:MAG TPA: UbiD family decarboxylase [Candidatus Binatia bacterium]|jgi:UbiD family decarboxylase